MASFTKLPSGSIRAQINLVIENEKIRDGATKKTMKAAKQWAEEREEELLKFPASVRQKNTTFSEAAEIYMDERKNNLKKMKMIRTHIEIVCDVTVGRVSIGDTALPLIDKDRVLDVIKQWGDKGLSESTISTYSGYLKRVIDHMVEEHDYMTLDDTAVKRARKSWKKKRKTQDQPLRVVRDLSEEERELVFDGSTIGDAAEFAYETGMRVSEVIEARLKHVTYKREENGLWVESTVPMLKVQTIGAKFGKERFVPLSGRAFEILQKRAHGFDYKSGHSLSANWARLRRELNVRRDLNFHKLRHIAISRYVNTPGVSIAAARDMAGHTSIATTNLYAHAGTANLIEAANAVEAHRKKAKVV